MTVAAGGSLGRIPRFVSLDQSGESNPGAPAVDRFSLRVVAGELLPKERVNWCLKRVIPTAQNAELWRNPEKQSGHWHNLATCGSVWFCPVCAAKITEARRVEVQTAVDCARAKGWTVALLTYTLQHDRDDKLDSLLADLLESIRRVQMGAGWQGIRQQYGIVGSISALEITWGRAAGWHPHKHVLLFLKGDQDLETLRTVISARYRAILDRAGRWASAEIGVDLRAGDEAVGDYLSKWGVAAELAKSPVKKGKAGGLSPFQLLAMAADGDKSAGRRFVEYAGVMKGRKQLFWSKGLRAVLGLGDDAEDQELSGDDLAGGQQELFAVLTRQQITQLNQIEQSRKGIKGELKSLAGAGDVVAFWGFLAQFGIKPTGLDQAAIGLYPWLDPRNVSPGETVKNGDTPYNPPVGAWEGLETILAGKRCQTTLEIMRRFAGAAEQLQTELSKEHDWDALNTRLDNKINQAKSKYPN